MVESATAFAPASIGNVAVGFDILGHSFAGAGDTVTVRRIEQPAVHIRAIRGVVADLPMQAEKNTAGMALQAMRSVLQLPFGFEIEIYKGIALGSGMGGSAASCVAALVAANAVLDQPLPREALYPFALEGEAVASGSRHGDNVGPMLLGGLVIASADRLVRVPVPDAWHALVVHPHAVLETRHARAALAGDYPLGDIVKQTTNLALVLSGCWSGDASLVRAGLADVLVEPRRAPLIDGFESVQKAALDAGAFGASIAGAGPSIFAWFETRAEADAAKLPMADAFRQAGFDCDVYLSPINGPRAELLR
ncbi:MAG: homoserine kinase [Dokdonella sp.]